MSRKEKIPRSSLTNLPSVDEVLRSKAINRAVGKSFGNRWLVERARLELASLRSQVENGEEDQFERKKLIEIVVRRINGQIQEREQSRIQRVINATGVVIHTNLGRSPLSENARRALLEAAGYCNLEYDLNVGKRGPRGRLAEQLICELSGAEDALVVNNGAAAALLILSALAKGSEVLVSRGELVEIGGEFRIPDVLEQSGATLREVGTTNRTKLADYTNAIRSSTGVILRVHPSNYRILGFTSKPELVELASLTKENGIILYEDLGSGAIIDFGINEPVIRDSLTAGADLVSFSGDKLLGAPQAGIIAGRRDLIAKLRSHPLYRALRADKLCYAALEATLLSYARGEIEAVPVVRMLSTDQSERSERFAARLRSLCTDLDVEVVVASSAVGGGAGAGAELASKALQIRRRDSTASELERQLRTSGPPVIGRIIEGSVILDLRTVDEKDEEDLISVLASIGQA